MFKTIRRITATTAAAAVLSAVGATALVEPADAYAVVTTSDGGYDVVLDYYEIDQVADLGLSTGMTLTRQWCKAWAYWAGSPPTISECTKAAAICAVDAVEHGHIAAFARIYPDDRYSVCLYR